MQRFTPIWMQWLGTCPWLSAAALGVLLIVIGGESVQAKSHTFLPLGFRNTACSGWEHVRHPSMQTVTFTGSVSSDGDVIGDFWYEYQNRWSRYALQTGTSYELTLSNPPAGAYQLCWSHTTAGPQRVTGTLTTTVLDGADLTVTKALVDIVSGEGVLTYELVVTNHGPGKALDVILKDALPFGVQVDSIGPYDDSPQELSADQPRVSFIVDDVEVSCELSDLEGQPIVSCHLGDLEVGQEVIITIRVLLMGEETGTIRNHVAVSAANGIAPFEDDADAVETPIDFWGEPIATCALEVCKLSTPVAAAPLRSATSPDVEVTVIDSTGLPAVGIVVDFDFSTLSPRDLQGPRLGRAGSDQKTTAANGMAVGSPLSRTGGRAPAWHLVDVSIDASTPVPGCTAVQSIRMKLNEKVPDFNGQVLDVIPEC